MGRTTNSRILGAMKGFFILFFLFLMIPIATAFPCELTDNPQCEEIQNLDLTEQEKELLYQSLIASDYPNHELIQDYNTNITFSQPPENTQIHSTSYIRNAWLEIATIMPSVILNDSLYSKETGNILTAYNYQIQLPANTNCETTYSLHEQTTTLNIYQNNQLIGNSNLQSYTISEDTEFRAELTIEVIVKEDHYEIQQGNIGENASCEYTHTTYSTEQISLSDAIEVKYFEEFPEGEVLLLDQIYDSYKGLIRAEEYANLKLMFNNSEYKQNNFYYLPEFTLKPYYVVTWRARVLCSRYHKRNFNFIQPL